MAFVAKIEIHNYYDEMENYSSEAQNFIDRLNEYVSEASDFAQCMAGQLEQLYSVNSLGTFVGMLLVR